MAGGSANRDLSQRFEILVHLGATGDLSDSQLLGRFLSSGDPASRAALAVLVERHGPMVLRACRQILDNPQDAEDAFQATFLVLARKAGSVRNVESVAGWLHGVARRVAIRSRTDESRRKALERRAGAIVAAANPDSPPAEAWPELHEEVARLPQRYREPVVLCYLEGLSTEAAALRIGCPKGTVLSRLSRARERLRGQLTRRGVVPPAVLISVAVGAATTQAQAVPAALLREVVLRSIEFASGRAAATSSAAQLARGVLLAMTISQLKIAAVVAVVGLFVTGSAVSFARSDDPLLKNRPVALAKVPLASPRISAEEALKRRRADAWKQLKVEVARVGGEVVGDGPRATVVLERTTASDEDLGRIAPLIRDLPQVDRLVLSHSLVTDAGLVHVKDLTGLTWLSLENTDVTSAGLAQIQGLTHLVGLPLENTDVGDEGMKHLSAMPHLQWLSLGNTQVGDAGLKHLAGRKPLNVLKLENTPITDAGLAHLEGLTELRELHLDNTRITDRGLAALKGLVKLERLHLCDTDVTDAGLVNLEPLNQLYYLQLHNTIDGLSNLFRNTVKVSDAGLVHLSGMKKNDQYGSIFLFNTAVTAAGVAKLREANPDLRSIGFGEQRLLGFSKTYREFRGSKPRGS